MTLNGRAGDIHDGQDRKLVGGIAEEPTRVVRGAAVPNCHYWRGGSYDIQSARLPVSVVPRCAASQSTKLIARARPLRTM